MQEKCNLVFPNRHNKLKQATSQAMQTTQSYPRPDLGEIIYQAKVEPWVYILKRKTNKGKMKKKKPFLTPVSQFPSGYRLPFSSPLQENLISSHTRNHTAWNLLCAFGTNKHNRKVSHPLFPLCISPSQGVIRWPCRILHMDFSRNHVTLPLKLLAVPWCKKFSPSLPPAGIVGEQLLSRFLRRSAPFYSIFCIHGTQSDCLNMTNGSIK